MQILERIIKVLAVCYTICKRNYIIKKILYLKTKKGYFLTHLMDSPVFVCNKCSGITQSFDILISSCKSIGMILCI